MLNNAEFNFSTHEKSLLNKKRKGNESNDNESVSTSLEVPVVRQSSRILSKKFKEEKAALRIKKEGGEKVKNLRKKSRGGKKNEVKKNKVLKLKKNKKIKNTSTYTSRIERKKYFYLESSMKKNLNESTNTNNLYDISNFVINSNASKNFQTDKIIQKTNVLTPGFKELSKGFYRGNYKLNVLEEDDTSDEFYKSIHKHLEMLENEEIENCSNKKKRRKLQNVK